MTISHRTLARTARASAMALALGALTLAPASTTAEAPDKHAEAVAKFPWQGEELYYKIKVNGSEAAHAVVRIGDVRMSKGQPYVALSAKAQSVGLFETVYPMDDRGNTFVDPLSGNPLRAEKIFREAGKGRTYRVDYDPGSYEAKVHKTYHADAQHAEERDRHYTRAMPSNTHDALTWFFELREVESFEPGDVLNFYVFDGWKLSRIELTVKGDDRVLTPMGWHNAVRFDFSREILGTKRKLVDRKPTEPDLRVITPAKPTGSIWLSSDAKRIPLKIKMSSALGTGEVEIAKYIAPKKVSARK